MNIIIERLVASYATLIMGNRRTIEDVPVTYTVAGTQYPLRELVELEVAERTIAAINP